jgi:hypothetical protein
VTLFPKGSVVFDEDLQTRSLAGVETLAQVGTSLACTATWASALLDHEE